MFIFVNRAMQFDSKHIIISNASHAAGGFGLAVLLQFYLMGSTFVPMWVGWVLVACSIVAHLWAAAKHTDGR